MKEILSLLPRPSHYLGIEEGSIHKAVHAPDGPDGSHDPDGSVALHCALAFPDMYEVGMSYLGHKILYDILNRRPDVAAERVFAPSPEAGDLLRRHQLPLATLESDTPLARTHLLGFAITHELCFTTVLAMLDLAGIPLHPEDRGESLADFPLVVAGGGCAICSEPLAPFMDLMLLGEGEELTVEVCESLMAARKAGLTRARFLREAARIPGVYVPSLYRHDEEGRLHPLEPDLPRPGRRVVADFNSAPYPERQVVPFGAVHNRLSLEIARGCTRGCRFCQAGILYRPARERQISNISSLLERCLRGTGYDDVSLLSLSSGDFSGLKTLFLDVSARCAQEQVSLSLPSLRVGSIDDDIMARMAGIRRTGATLAPEAGSQRLRDVINKGISEEEVLAHARALVRHGWQQVKLYFMIGLPGETDEDLDAIVDLCRKVRDAARPPRDSQGSQGPQGPRLQVTAAISPFVPKPFTPFQWEAQVPPDECRRRIDRLRDAFRAEKGLKIRWHDPDMSWLEGLLSRGDRRLAPVVEKAFRKGAIFAGWVDHFRLQPWLEALAECGLSPEAFGARPLDSPLPWDHLEAGVSTDFLLRERERALAARTTGDCRYEACQACGACDRPGSPSRLPRSPRAGSQSAAPSRGDLDSAHRNRLNFAQRDQMPPDLSAPDLPAPAPSPAPARGKKTAPPAIDPRLTVRAVRYRIWHTREGGAAFVSQLELQSLLDRSMRRAALPLSFSCGFHPLPLISFGRALPVGVESLSEWFSVTLRQNLSAHECASRLAPSMPHGMRLLSLDPIPIHDKSVGSIEEAFILRCLSPESRASFLDAWQNFIDQDSFSLVRETKKGERHEDIRPLVRDVELLAGEASVRFMTDWSQSYLSPLTLVRAVTPDLGPHQLRLVKLAQIL